MSYGFRKGAAYGFLADFVRDGVRTSYERRTGVRWDVVRISYVARKGFFLDVRAPPSVSVASELRQYRARYAELRQNCASIASDTRVYVCHASNKFSVQCTRCVPATT